MNAKLPRIETVSPRAGKNLSLSLAPAWAGGSGDVFDLSGWIATGGYALKDLDRPKIFRTAIQ
jgi:hypothetical protein